jgi:hypothetical protein
VHKKLIIVSIMIVGLIIFLGCEKNSKGNRPIREEEIEISPGKFITIERMDKGVDEGKNYDSIGNIIRSFWEAITEPGEWTWIRIPWNGFVIEWMGADIPVTVREYDRKLYMIGFDRETNREKFKFRYYEQIGNSFKEILPSTFPKPIATQNMWFIGRYSIGAEGNKIDEVQLARDLDPRNIYFENTTTAEIWYQLMTGKEYYEFERKSLDNAVLIEFADKYKPIKLTTIVREKGDVED